MKQLDIIVATYSPTFTDDLPLEWVNLIGWRGEWQAYWIIEEGKYAGQWAMLRYPPVSGSAVGWVPESDLVQLDQVQGHLPERVNG